MKQVTAKDIGELNQNELDLIFLIRKKYRFGRLEIVVADGVPRDTLKTIERTRLGALSTEQIDEISSETV